MNKEMILVVDDSVVSRNILCNILRTKYFVLEASTEKIADTYIKQNTDVLVMVLVSETVNYQAVRRSMNSFIRKKFVPAILLVSSINEGVNAKAKENGFYDLLNKPYVKDIVLARVESFILSCKRDHIDKSEFEVELNSIFAKNEEQVDTAIGSCKINFTKQEICEEQGYIKELIGNEEAGSFSDIIEGLSKSLIKSSKKDFVELFDFKNIKAKYKTETASLQYQALFNYKGKVSFFSFNVLRVSNFDNGDEGALFVINDNTKEYDGSKVQQALFENEFELVTIIDSTNFNVQLVTYKTNVFKFDEGVKETSYEEVARQIAFNYHGQMDKDEVAHKLAKEQVETSLAEFGAYSVVIFSNDERISFFEINFKYLDEFKQKILLSIENVTTQREIDYLTGGYSYHGFLNKCYEEYRKTKKKYAVVFCKCENYRDIIEFVTVDVLVNFLKSFYAYLKRSFLNPYYIGRADQDNIWLFCDIEGIDFTRLNELKNINITQEDKTYSLNLKFGVYKMDRINRINKSYDVDTLCERAKIAEESIKRESQDNYAIFNDTLRNDFIIKSTLLNDIKGAVENDELEVYYQPVYDIAGKNLVAAEALVRWNHPQYGQIAPGLFISTIESNGYISIVDKVVIRKVNQFLQRITDEGYKISVSVNLSRLDFFDNELITMIKDISKEHKGNKFYMNYEVTESYYIDLSNNMSTTLQELRSYGASILLDDFGDGFSSFNALINSSFDIIKIYKGLTDQIETNVISCEAIKSIIFMAHQVGLKVIAEGVENDNQVYFLKSAGCDMIQGFIFGTPIPQDAFYELITKKGVKGKKK